MYKYIQKIFRMTNNFVGLQYFLAVFDLGLKLCMFKRATRPFVDTHFDTHFVHSVRNMVFLTEDAIFEAHGIGSDC